MGAIHAVAFGQNKLAHTLQVAWRMIVVRVGWGGQLGWSAVGCATVQLTIIPPAPGQSTIVQPATG